MSDDVLIKFGGGQCHAASCGSKNPVAAMIAMAMLTENGGLGVAQAQEAAVQAGIGNGAVAGVGGIGF